MNINNLTTRERELYIALKNGSHIYDIDPVKKSVNISWRIHIVSYIKKKMNLDISATLSRDGSLFFGWITEDNKITHNLHPVEWKFIMEVISEICPEFAKKVSDLA